MASALYDYGRELFAKGGVNWQTGGSNVRAVLVKTAYAVNLSAHEYLSDVGAANLMGSGAANDQANSANVAPSTSTAGVCRGANVTFTAVAAGNNASYIILYEGTGNDANSRLLAYIDTATGLPVVPNGGDIAVNWDQGANGIFKL
jgi:hypothetical protein